MAIGTRVPHRQTKDIDSELEIYTENAGAGINRKPYITDEFQLFKDELDRLAALNKKKQDALRS